jgi:replication factor A1
MLSIVFYENDYNFSFVLHWRWTIRGRVTQKSAIRTWSNSRGEGKLFNIVLVDESGEIRATAFTQEVEKFYNLIEVNKVIYAFMRRL